MEEETWKSSMAFYVDQETCSADIISPSEVIARIQISVLNFLQTLNSLTPEILHLPLIRRTSANRRVNKGLWTNEPSIFLSHAFCVRSLTRLNSSKAFVRVWKVMEMCIHILQQEKRVTQRELFYKLLCSSREYFTSQIQVNRTIQDVVALLRCSRYSLGIMAAARGIIAGRLWLQEPGKEAVDCSTCGSSGYPISGDLDLLEKTNLRTDARYVIVVEKHAIFQRLTEDHIFNKIPCILITGKGYPDIATRLMLHKLSRCFPRLRILALVDWNPAGLAIACTFKHGSITMGLEAYRYSCNLSWLGIRANDLHLLPSQSFLPLKSRDLQIARSLKSSDVLQVKYKMELDVMIEKGKRAEIEALYCHGFDFVGKYIVSKIVEADYI